MTVTTREEMDDGDLQGNVLDLNFTSEEIKELDFCTIAVDDRVVAVFEKVGNHWRVKYADFAFSGRKTERTD